MPVENIVSQHQSTTGRADKVAANEKRLSDSLWRGLNCILKANTETRTVPQELLEPRSVLWRGDDQNVSYAR